MVNTNITLNAV